MTATISQHLNARGIRGEDRRVYLESLLRAGTPNGKRFLEPWEFCALFAASYSDTETVTKAIREGRIPGGREIINGGRYYLIDMYHFNHHEQVQHTAVINQSHSE